MNNYFKKYLKYKQKYYSLKYGGRILNKNEYDLNKKIKNFNKSLMDSLLKNNIGQGSFGKVSAGPLLKCAVEKKKCFENYAIKEINFNKENEKNIKSEIKILEELKNHPNIITLYSYEKKETDKKYKLIFEYIATGTLETYIKNIESKSNSNSELKKKLYFKNLFIVYQLLKGVSFIHKKGILHLDLKPANLLISYKNEIPILKIADFGISNFIKKAGIDIKGSPYYLYPKKIEEKNSKINDKWTCGLIIYELFSNGKILYTELFPNIEKLGPFIKKLRKQGKNMIINNIQNNTNIDNFIKNIIIKLFNNINLNNILDLIYEKLDENIKHKIKKMYSSYKLKVQKINKKKEWGPAIDFNKILNPKQNNKKWGPAIDVNKILNSDIETIKKKNNFINSNIETIKKNNFFNSDIETIKKKNNFFNSDIETIKKKNNFINSNKETIKKKNNFINSNKETIKKNK